VKPSSSFDRGVPILRGPTALTDPLPLRMNPTDARLAPPGLSSPRLGPGTRARRVLLWTALLALLAVAQSLLVLLSLDHARGRAQDAAERAAQLAAEDMQRTLLQQLRALQALSLDDAAPALQREAVRELLRGRQGLERVEWRSRAFDLVDAIDTPYAPALFGHQARQGLATEAAAACAAARIAGAPGFSRSYWVPGPEGRGREVVDLCLPQPGLGSGRGHEGALVASFSLLRALELAHERLLVPDSRLEEHGEHELSLVEADGTRLARAGPLRGAGAFVARQVLDLPGFSAQVQANGARGRPSLVPSLSTALVLGLSLALFAVVALLARDGRRRAQAEAALAESLALRRAMEDSLPTGLRARDLQGRVTYANPAFCAMVGFSPAELLTPAAEPGGPPPTPPYWPPEFAPVYQQRLQDQARGPDEAREGRETVFMRKGGERFPVRVYEAPLVDGQGRHTGWMSAVVELTAQRRVEELSRQQQERLQASARLAMVGEMASLLSHELNQPLSAIASYASGSVNLLDGASAADAGQAPLSPGLHGALRQALARIAEQADRAGRVIKSVHASVRRHEPLHERVAPAALFDAVMPLVRLQARKSGTHVVERLAPDLPQVRCDRTRVEQVLLNLARNGLQAIESAPDGHPRRLVLAAEPDTAPDRPGQRVRFSVCDSGPGIAPEVAAQLFTPFFSTRAEGMGLGLSLCRTVAEQHGAALAFGPGEGGQGTLFHFSLPMAPGPGLGESGDTADPAA